MNKAELLDIENIEIHLLLEAIYQQYGYDFREYSPASIKRRIRHFSSNESYASVSDIIKSVLREPAEFNKLLNVITVNVTEMFRDPDFYQDFVKFVVPVLQTYPSFKLWHAGCATGEEAYSIAIFLKEFLLYDNAQLYATDVNADVLEKAKKGIFPCNNIDHYESNYKRAGGKKKLAEYYTSGYNAIVMASDLKERLLFTQHNLCTDGAFGEMQVIFCRNVLIYFQQDLQHKVIKLFYNSLDYGGYLCVGSKETLAHIPMSGYFEQIADSIYKKISGAKV